MPTLLKFEFKRFWKNKKNCLILLVTILILFSLTFLFSFLNNKYQLEYINKLNFEKSYVQDYIISINYDISAHEELLKTNNNEDTKNTIEKLYEKKEIIYQWHSALLELGHHKKDRVARLPYEVKRNQVLLNGVEKGIIKLGEINVIDYNAESLKKETEIKKYMISNNIEPLSSPYEVNLQNFMSLLLSYPFSLILIITILVSCIDIVSEDFECGSYKTLYSENYGRSQIFFSKWMSGIVNSMIVWLAALVIISGYIIISNSLGNFNYPFYFPCKGIIPYKDVFIMQLPFILIFRVIIVSAVQLFSIIMKEKSSVILTLFTILIFDFIIRDFLPMFNTFWKFSPLNALELNGLFSNIGSMSSWLMYIIIQAIFGFLLIVCGLKKLIVKDL